VERILEPRSGLGTGWRSRLSCDMPLVFHALPENLRIRVVERHLGPAPCWFTRDAIVDKVPLHLGATLEGAEATGSGIRVTISQNGEKKRIEAEHVIAGTGFKVALSRLAHDRLADSRQALRILRAGTVFRGDFGRQQLRAAAPIRLWCQLRG
jgi:hypothetical protein